MTDRRLTPATQRVAHVSLKGKVDAPRFVEGEPARVTVPVADLLAAPGGPRDRQLLFGDEVLLIDREAGHGFVMAVRDGYCGWVADAALGPALAATHRLSAPASHVYSAPDIKSPELGWLSLGARVTVTDQSDRFATLAGRGFVPLVHLRPVDSPDDDPASVALSLLGTPYLWGGNSRQGIDCSGLVQAALLSCGIACPGDSDLQASALGQELPDGTVWRRNDLFFWKGHVAMAIDATRLVHANAFHMAVAVEGIADCIARIAATRDGALRFVRRLG